MRLPIGASWVCSRAELAGRNLSAPRRDPAGSELPDLVDPLPAVRDGVESAQDTELLVEDCEATGQGRSRDSRPGSSNRADHVGDRVVAEYAIWQCPAW